MASKRDQLQAYQFLVQRASSALVARETDPEQPPFRRSALASIASVAIAIVVLAGFGVYGMIAPGGNNTWRTANAVIVEKETGARYVYLNGRLHPVSNYVSALLLLGNHGATELVSRRSLASTPRGPRIGIPDAPDALPGPDRLLWGPWSLCTAPASDAAGSRIEESVLLVGTEPIGGSDLADQALLVELVKNGDRFMLWHGHRHKIDNYGVVGTGLTLTTESWARVGQTWLDVLPEGAPIGPIEIPHAGQPSTAVPGRADLRVGTLLMVQTSGGGHQYYLAQLNDLQPITDLQYDIQRAYAPVQAAYPGADPHAVPLAPALAASARQHPAVQTAGSVAPSARPTIVRLRDREATVCTIFGTGDASPLLRIEPELPPADPLTTTALRSSAGTPLADRVYVPPGSAAVVEAMPSPLAPAGTLTVVTDLGRRYPLSSPDVLTILGYPGIHPLRLPGTLVARLPEGPSLDPDAAREYLSG